MSSSILCLTALSASGTSLTRLLAHHTTPHRDCIHASNLFLRDELETALYKKTHYMKGNGSTIRNAKFRFKREKRLVFGIGIAVGKVLQFCNQVLLVRSTDAKP